MWLFRSTRIIDINLVQLRKLNPKKKNADEQLTNEKNKITAPVHLQIDVQLMPQKLQTGRFITNKQ